MPLKTYRKLYLGKTHPWAGETGYVSTHRYIMMCALNRKLSPHEFVHHQNHDIHDNRIANLALMTPSRHSSHHRQLHGRWAKKYDRCENCGTTTRPHQMHGLCARCCSYDRRTGRPRPADLIRYHPIRENTKTRLRCAACHHVFPRTARFFYGASHRCKRCYLQWQHTRYGNACCVQCHKPFSKRSAVQRFVPSNLVAGYPVYDSAEVGWNGSVPYQRLGLFHDPTNQWS